MFIYISQQIELCALPVLAKIESSSNKLNMINDRFTNELLVHGKEVSGRHSATWIQFSLGLPIYIVWIPEKEKKPFLFTKQNDSFVLRNFFIQKEKLRMHI